MVYFNILALSVLKLYFDARKINKSMQNELFKRSNTNARRELSFSITISFLSLTHSYSYRLCPFVANSQLRTRQECRRLSEEQVYAQASNVTSIAC